MIIYIFPTRIKDARTSIINYGVDEKYVFKVEDVLHKRNTPKVVRCLEEVAKLVRKQINTAAVHKCHQPLSKGDIAP